MWRTFLRGFEISLTLANLSLYIFFLTLVFCLTLASLAGIPPWVWILSNPGDSPYKFRLILIFCLTLARLAGVLPWVWILSNPGDSPYGFFLTLVICLTLASLD